MGICQYKIWFKGGKGMKEKFRNFMMGRYGADSFSRFLLVFAIILMIISMFVLREPLYITSLILIIYGYYRIFSKNISSRYKENQIYLSIKGKVKTFFHKKKYRFMQRRIYHIYRCPGCSQKIRIPRGKGKISITCPRCQKQFIKRS